jgi:hypothetical protein
MRLALLTFPEAHELAALGGIEQDLRATVDQCDHALNVLSLNADDWRNVEAITHAAIVRYCRAFSSGVRLSSSAVKLCLEKTFESLDAQYRQDHKFFEDIRNKFIAHSVNALEENAVFAHVVDREDGGFEIRHVELHHERVAFLGMSEIERLKNLAQTIVRLVRAQIAAQRKVVIEVARKLPQGSLAFSSGEAMRIDTSRKAIGKRR